MVGIASTTNAIGQVLSNQVDLAIVSQPLADRQIAVAPLLDKPLVAILSPDARNAPRRSCAR